MTFDSLFFLYFRTNQRPCFFIFNYFNKTLKTQFQNWDMYNMRKNKVLLLIGILLGAFSLMIFSSERNIMGIPTKYLSDPTNVISTIYYPWKNNKKNITASGYRFKHNLSDTCRIIAISRDLRKKYPFHTKVLLVGTGEDDGIYRVEDLMHQKHKNRVDILVHGKHKLIKYNSVTIFKINPDYFKELMRISFGTI